MTSAEKSGYNCGYESSSRVYTRMPLTDVKIRQAKPAEKPYKLSDGHGLHLLVQVNGKKAWRYRYRLAGKENMYALGFYPEINLAQAREEHARAARLVAGGTHPAHERAKGKAERLAQNEDTFRVMAEEWMATKVATETRKGWSPYYAGQVRSYFERDVYPTLGNRPITSITPHEWLACIKAVENRGAPTAAILLRQNVSQVYTYAINNLKAESDPTYSVRRAVTRPPVRHADAKDREAIKDLLGRVATYGGNRTTALALRLMLLLFVRTNEMRRTPWAEIRPALASKVWTIPAERMKKRRKHMVPLPRQAVALLEELQAITGANANLFPNNRRPRDVMSATTVNRALEHMGYASGYFTGHDFRATASTALHEMGYRDEIVDMQLAHAKEKRGKSGAAYNHAAYLDERKAMMQAWADYIDAIEAEITPPPAPDPAAPARRAGRSPSPSSRRPPRTPPSAS